MLLETCPLCDASALAEEVSPDWFHFKCPTCTEFIASVVAVKHIRRSISNWGEVSSQEARTAPPGLILKIRRASEEGPPELAFIGEYVSRSDVLKK